MVAQGLPARRTELRIALTRPRRATACELAVQRAQQMQALRGGGGPVDQVQPVQCAQICGLGPGQRAGQRILAQHPGGRGIQDIQEEAAGGRVGAAALGLRGKHGMHRADGQHIGALLGGGHGQLAQRAEVPEAMGARQRRACVLPQAVDLRADSPAARVADAGQVGQAGRLPGRDGQGRVARRQRQPMVSGLVRGRQTRLAVAVDADLAFHDAPRLADDPVRAARGARQWRRLIDAGHDHGRQGVRGLRRHALAAVADGLRAVGGQVQRVQQGAQRGGRDAAGPLAGVRPVLEDARRGGQGGQFAIRGFVGGHAGSSSSQTVLSGQSSPRASASRPPASDSNSRVAYTSGPGISGAGTA
ncbi:hypothetical protein D3C71_304640 [compost metagenome]